MDIMPVQKEGDIPIIDDLPLKFGGLPSGGSDFIGDDDDIFDF